MPQERITLTLGPLSSSLTSHATHLSLTTSTISSPYDPSKFLRLVDDKNVLRIRGVIVDEKGSFIDYTTPEENLEDTSSAWTGATSIFDMTDNESMNANALRSSLMPQTTNPGSFFDLKPAQPEKSIPSKGREVDWDAYMEEDTNPQIQEEESTQQLGDWNDFESALESCGGISGIKSWISYHPIPSPLYVPMPTFNLVRDGKDSVFSCTEVEEVEESVRKLLEECDSVSEIDLNITHDDKNYYWLGMSSKILQFISEETRRSYITTTVSCGKLENEEEEVVGEIMRENRRDVRRAVNVGVGLNGVREFSDVIIPVDYSKCEEMLQSSQSQNVGEINCVSKPRLIKTNIFTAGAVAGLVIDSAFSSTNLKTNHAGGGVTVAGAGISGDGGEINATRMGKSEMGNVVKPSYRHKIVELEGGWISGREFKNIIKGEGEGEDERIRGGVKEGDREYTIKKLLKPLGGIDGGEEGKFFGISGAAR
ncbi:hypothetical protein TL16_g02998 [Triparma laevis f. inornata]|nr:hypothetical protein TL16_g02998 [Triparma laevis f. inornata]